MAKLRRLHLIMVDLLHPRRSASRAFRYAFDTMCRARPRLGSNTTPIPLEGRAVAMSLCIWIQPGWLRDPNLLAAP